MTVPRCEIAAITTATRHFLRILVCKFVFVIVLTDGAFGSDLDGSIAITLRAAETGDPIAENQLGFAYEHGREVPQDIHQAMVWYRRAAQHGNAVAQYNLAFLVERGATAPPDLFSAAVWYRRAAEGGLPLAQTRIGLMHEVGEGGQPLDAAQALWWYRLAANHGYSPAAFRAGLLLESGHGEAADVGAAARYYRQAADGGVAAAQVNLGRLLEQGSGVRRDRAEALRWYRRAADQGSAAGQFNLAVFLEMGLEGTRDVVTAASMYRKSASQGFAPAEANLGFMLEHGIGGPANEEEARSWYHRAAEQGNSAGSFNYGFMLESGKGGAKDLVEAEKWFRLAVRSGLPAAALKVALIDMERQPPKTPTLRNETRPKAQPLAPIGSPAPRPVVARPPRPPATTDSQISQSTKSSEGNPPHEIAMPNSITASPTQPGEAATEVATPEKQVHLPPGLGANESDQAAQSPPGLPEQPIEVRLAMAPPAVNLPPRAALEPDMRLGGTIPPAVFDCTKFSPNGDFQWPARGVMLSGYGAQDAGQFNDGINMVFPEKSTFCAAADGKVVYVGNKILGYGNLILVKHKDGWMSVYAHVREFRVARGDRVSRGQVLGVAGSRDQAQITQLHFEIRHHTVAQDPIAVLGHPRP